MSAWSRRAGRGGNGARTALGEPWVATLTDVPRTPDGRVDLDAAADALSPCDLLDSADDSGWSYLVPHGGAALTDDGRASRLLRPEDTTVELGADPFRALDAVCDRYGLGPETSHLDGLPPLAGGLVGALAYDLCRRVERVPTLARPDRDQLHLHLRLAEVVLAVPAERDRALLIVHRGERTADRAAVGDQIADQLRRASRPDRPPRPDPQPVDTSLARDDYLDAVEAVLEAIAAGDVFQVNLTQRLTAGWPGDTHELFRAMRAISPAPNGAALPSIGIASVSPETFLAVDGGRVTTRPIKGTRPRSPDPTLDAALADDLATAAKDRAENVMVVDLERNDLGRVCVPGSIEVPHLLEVEAHPTVWHLASTVVGRLRGGVGYGQLLRATFPCGSITGAPKVAAMELIERLEPVRRGWYCGAIGFLAPGRARLSVAIRTATLHPDGRVDYGAGGGIVADSDPHEELAESLDKAALFLRAVGATGMHQPDGSPVGVPPR